MCGKVIVLLSTYTVEVFELQSYILILLKFAKKNNLSFSLDFLQLATNLRILHETEFVYLFLPTGKIPTFIFMSKLRRFVVIKLSKLSKNYLINEFVILRKTLLEMLTIHNKYV